MNIQNIVVLMLETRSCDHLLGALSTVDPQVAGLVGTEFNYEDPRNPQSDKISVTPASKFPTLYAIPFDPEHEFFNVQMQLYGPRAATDPAQPPVPNRPTPNSADTPLNGFMFTANASTAPVWPGRQPGPSAIIRAKTGQISQTCLR